MVFENRRAYAKLRRLGYFVPESEQLYRRLLFDQLDTQEGLYDFKTFDVQNPIIEDVLTETQLQTDDTSEPKIDVIDTKIIKIS